MKASKKHIRILLLLLLFSVIASAQSNRQFSVASFALDQFDMTARNDQYKKVDGNGSLYAIIKVTSTDRDDNLSEYRFNFGNMNHEVVSKDGELWVYVQRNAKFVTIMRKGFTQINKYDLGLTIEEGRTYTIRLSPTPKRVLSQMVLFSVNPIDSKATILAQLVPDGMDDVVGITDETGAVAKPLPYGNYKYRVVAEGFYSSEGNFTLNNLDQTHEEKIILKPKFAIVTLSTSGDADIYVNGEKKGRGTWKGRLNGGSYQVECRQQNHRSSSQPISVKENETRTFDLVAPTPITGMLTVVSQPNGAAITIDGEQQGKTPRQFSNFLIGQHTIVIAKDGYENTTQIFDVKENETTNLSLSMNKATEIKTSTTSDIPLKDMVTPANDDKTFTVNGVSFVMKAVLGGMFQMGTDDRDAYLERPRHIVTLSSYMIGETEVTQELWQAVMGKNPSEFKDSNKPVEQVSWDDCQKFIKKLNSLTGLQFRLPTEAEWEYAARGGNKSKGYKYAGSNIINKVAWYSVNSGSKTHEVKTKAPNELGLYDMSGNVWEWCQDRYGEYTSSSQTNPEGPNTGSYRMLRGGGINGNAGGGTVWMRNFASPSKSENYWGFRLALTQENDNMKDYNRVENQVLGVVLHPITQYQKEKFDIKYGLEIKNMASGKMKDAGIPKGFIIQNVNDMNMMIVNDFEEVVKKSSIEKEPILIIKGLYLTGKRGYFVVSLAQ